MNFSAESVVRHSQVAFCTDSDENTSHASKTVDDHTFVYSAFEDIAFSFLFSFFFVPGGVPASVKTTRRRRFLSDRTLRGVKIEIYTVTRSCATWKLTWT
ncbi:hypothetical protein SCHPADRAFT_646771 [Schizopora paradoxa]|uniref:Uncharacterized protein n=1 Tax=Schizopora paradoxa TaxID=27342 RepID=A0A0H2R7X8_9AGAM|nr:hypothetical protein SCHPADRAFT_646771 [Schizopora paradoxa]